MSTLTGSLRSPAEIAEAVKAEPLIGTSAGARLLGIKPSNFKRDAAPHLTEMPVEGSGSAYFRSEVERLREQRAAKVAQNGSAAAAA